MAYVLSNTSKDRLKGVLPIMVQAFEAAIQHPECPEDFGIPQDGGLRTTADQQRIFAQGRTKPGPIVTKTDGVVRKSNHQVKPTGFGHAIDIYIYDHKTKTAVWDKARLQTVARHIQKVALEVFKLKISWGGDWTSFKDYPHFEVMKLPENWKDYNEVAKAPVAKAKPVAKTKA
jgi:peptidoglycan L-alanyl-D-glutamate endopeptidase CwlK